MTNLCPRQVEILLHAYTTPAPYEKGGSAAQQYIRTFICNDILHPIGMDGQIRLTDLGKAWVACILNTEQPTFGYFDKDGNRIEIDEH